MSIPLYMDEHVPSEITQGVRARGVNVLTAQEDGRTGTPDFAYAPLIRITIARCVESLELVSIAGDPMQQANRVEYLPL